jgi:sarcosine oxidase
MASNENHFDVIVLGVGSMGSAACYHLAKRGAKVLGLDQFEIPHNHGSHHGKSRMIRKAYYEHPDYVPLLQRAYELWDELEHAATNSVFKRTGALYLGKSDDSVVSGSIRSARQHKLPHRYLETVEIKRDFPAFSVPDCFDGFYEPDGGYLCPENGIEEHAWQAARLGTSILTNTPALSWQADKDGVEVKTMEGTLHADQLIVSAGAWTNSLLKDLGIQLTVTRQIQAWFEPKGDPQRFSPENFPCWFIETGPPYGHYGFPILPGQKGLKIAEHRPGSQIPIEQIGKAIEPPTAKELDSLQQILVEYIPGAAGPLLKSCTCLYTNSPDQHFIIGKHPIHDRVTMAAGFSGHGYKFAPVIGEILADLSTDGKTRHPVEFLSLERFT